MDPAARDRGHIHDRALRLRQFRNRWFNPGTLGAVMMTLMVLIMLESGAIYGAEQGQVPDGVARRLPPPAELQPLEAGADPSGDAEESHPRL